MSVAALPEDIAQDMGRILGNNPMAGISGGGISAFPVSEQDTLGNILPAPVGVDVGLSKKYKRQQQGLVHLRLRGERLTSDSLVEIRAESASFSSPLTQSVCLELGGTHELDALRLVPRLAGAEQIRFAVTVKSLTKTPLGRWSGSVVALVDDEEKKKVEAGRDVIIVGGAVPGGELPDFDNPPGVADSPWQPLTLAPDRNYNRRLLNACPEAADRMSPVLDSSFAWPTGATAQGAVYIRDRQTGAARAVGVVCGTSASLGRGGDPAVAWWLQPSPYDAHQHGRLSRQHALLALHDNRAWITDWSTNGTWLNGERLSRSENSLVADGDRLEPARIVPMTIKLLASGGKVHAVWLERSDAMGEQLQYLLTDCQMPIAVLLPGRSAPSLWLAWRRTKPDGAEALVCGGDDSTFQTIGDQKVHVIASRYCVRWQPFSVPLEQPDYLNQLNAFA